MDADRIATALVVEGLAACVNATPGVTSTYLWEGVLCREPETTLTIKVAGSKLAAACARLRELHGHTTPEILVIPVDVERSDARYVAWVEGK